MRFVTIHQDDPDKDQKIVGDPYKTLYVGRLNWNTTEDALHKVFGEFGRITNLRLIRDIGSIAKTNHQINFSLSYWSLEGLCICNIRTFERFSPGV